MTGAVKLDAWEWDVSHAVHELEAFLDDDWTPRTAGVGWSDIRLVQDNGHGAEIDPKLKRCPTLEAIADEFGGLLLDMSLARLEPGGRVSTHRDLSGGVAMGVARLHVALVTDPAVEFIVSGRTVHLGPGQVWLLDTTYPHSVENRSSRARIHLILDVRIDGSIAARLPPRTVRDRLHTLSFWTVVSGGKALTLVRHPSQLLRQVQRVYRLKVRKESVL
jgi:hypothetical protein